MQKRMRCCGERKKFRYFNVKIRLNLLNAQLCDDGRYCAFSTPMVKYNNFAKIIGCNVACNALKVYKLIVIKYSANHGLR